MTICWSCFSSVLIAADFQHEHEELIEKNSSEMKIQKENFSKLEETYDVQVGD